VIRPRGGPALPACVAALRQVHEADGYPAVWPRDPIRFLTPSRTHGAWVAESAAGITAHGALCGADDVAPAAGELAAAVGVPEDRLLVIARLFVVPAARRTGTGRALLTHLVAEARAANAHPVLDVVAGSTPAVTLYESAGWRRITTLKATWTDATGANPALHYYVAPA